MVDFTTADSTTEERKAERKEDSLTPRLFAKLFVNPDYPSPRLHPSLQLDLDPVLRLHPYLHCFLVYRRLQSHRYLHFFLVCRRRTHRMITDTDTDTITVTDMITVTDTTTDTTAARSAIHLCTVTDPTAARHHHRNAIILHSVTDQTAAAIPVLVAPQ